MVARRLPNLPIAVRWSCDLLLGAGLVALALIFHGVVGWGWGGVVAGVVGLVAQHGAAGVAGDDGGDAQQAQGPGLPLSGRGAGKRQCLAEGGDVAGQGSAQHEEEGGWEPHRGPAVGIGTVNRVATAVCHL